MTLRELERREAELHLVDQVAGGDWICTNCGTNIAEFVTPEGLLCRPCHVELIGPVDPWDENPEEEEANANAA